MTATLVINVSLDLTLQAGRTGARLAACGRRAPCCKAQRAAELRYNAGIDQHATEVIPMSLNKVSSGRDVPNDFNVIIEIPMNADPIKYEVDKESGAIFVDRFMGTAMHYPCNYGYVPRTIADDGDPCDVLVITPFPLIPGVVVRCRAIGVLKMTDEAGGDAKILAVPVDKILPIYKHWQKPEDMNELRLRQIQHFFEHYKDLEEGKWVKIEGWAGPEDAKKEILDGIATYEKAEAAK
jgi:inorganic pyrophosphatase